MEARSRKTGTVDRRPPRPIEAAVERLTPGPFRECVLGDLSERYRSAGSYLADAAGTLASLVAGQARRAFDPVLVIAEASALTIAFVSSSLRQSHPGALLVPLVALGVLRLRDAYRYPHPISTRGACLDAVIAATFVVAFEAAAATLVPELALDGPRLARGVGMALLGVPLVRVVFAPRRPIRSEPPPPARTLPAWSSWAFWILAGAAMVSANTESLPTLNGLRPPVAALMLLFALVGASSQGRARGVELCWRVGAQSLFFAALALPLAGMLWAPLGMDAPLGTVHMTALVTLSVLWRHKKPGPLPVS